MKPSTHNSGVLKIRPLKEPLLVFADESRESRKVLKLLDAAGVVYVVSSGAVEPWQRKPLVLFHTSIYEGFSDVEGLLRFLSFRSGQQTIEWGIFKTA